MAANKIPFGEDPLDRRHRAGGLAERCPECGARPRPGENCCWFCESKRLPLAGFEPVTDKKGIDLPDANHVPTAGLQFSIGTMLLVTTLVAICLAITLAIPPLGISVCVIAVGGLVRTAIVGWARIRAGQRFEILHKIEEFWISSSMFIVAAMCFVGTIAIVAVWMMFVANLFAEFSPLLSGLLVYATIPLGIAAGLFAFVRVYLTFAPTVREQIASTPEQQPLNQMSGTGYRHRPK